MYKQVISSIFNDIFEKKTNLFKALLIPLVLLVVLEQLIPLGVDGDSKESAMSMMTIVGFFILFVINIVMAIITHRVLLLEDENISKNWGLYKFTGREFKFFYMSVIMGIIILIATVIIMVPLSFLSTYTNSEVVVIGMLILVFLIASFLFSRLSLILPSIAIDKDISFTQSWVLTSKYKFLAFLCVVLIPTFVALIISAIYGLAIGFLTTVISSKLVFLNSVLNVFVNVFVISALSATYKHLVPKDFDRIEVKDETINQSKEITVFDKDGISKVYIPFSLEYSFDDIKELVKEQYTKLGFDCVVVDKENSWMLKTSDIGQAYVGVSILNENYKIESYNTQRPNQELFKIKEVEL